MSSVKLNKLQVGQSGTTTQNFVLNTPLTPDGSMTVSRGVIDGTLTQISKLKADSGVNLGKLCFSAYASSVTSISSSTVTKIGGLGNVEYDNTNGGYSSTNSRFTPNVAGVYLVTGEMYYNSTSSGATQSCGILKNGNPIKWGAHTVVQGSCAAVCALVQLNGTTDYIEMCGYTTGSTMSVAANSISDCYFQVALMEAS